MNIPINSYIICILIAGIFYIPGPKKNSINQETSIELGRQIYMEGVSKGNSKIMASVMNRTMPGNLYACSNCHGECGKAQLQQGMDIPDITREAYIIRYFPNDSKTSIGSKVNYSLKKFITNGINHSGEKVNSMMPKYNMSLEDIEHLLSFLEVLGTDEKCVKK